MKNLKLFIVFFSALNFLQANNLLEKCNSNLLCEATTNIEVLVISGNVVRIAWDSLPNIDQYKVRFRPIGESWMEVKTKGAEGFRVLNALTPNTEYQYGVKSICDTETSVWSATNTFTTLGTYCDRPESSSIVSIRETGALITWPTDPDDTKYKIKYKRKGTNEAWTTIFANTNEVNLTGLQAETIYKYKLKSKCPDGWNNWSENFEFTTLPDLGCGDQFFDLGGPSADYGNNKHAEYVICPDVFGDVISVSFSSFSLENEGMIGCFDGLTIYNGDRKTSPTINPPSAGTEWCWDRNDPTPTGTGDLNGMTITSSDVSGCLIFVFQSDGFFTRSGWEATITCGPADPCPPVFNLVTTNITDASATVYFDYFYGGGYTLEYGPTPFTPGTGIEITGTTISGTNTVMLSNLSTNTEYEYVISTECDNGVFQTFTTLYGEPACGGFFTDSGGVLGDYTNNETEEYVICPDVAGEVVSINFTYFNLENSGPSGCYDVLRIYDGANTNAPEIRAPGGESVWCWDLDDAIPGGTGNLAGMTLTSTDATGCITFLFESDNSQTRDGWEATITCAPPFTSPETDDLRISKTSEDALQLFPNPTTELLNINLPKSEWLQIRNIHGQIVYEQSTIEGQIEVVVHDLPSGLYYVNALTTEQEVLTKTFVKK